MINPIETKIDPVSLTRALQGDAYDLLLVAKLINQMALRIERLEMARYRSTYKGRFNREYLDRWITVDDEIKGLD